MRVDITPGAMAYLDRLETLLYEKGYFSFKEDAREYVHKLLHAIRDTLPTRLHRRAPRRFDPDGRGMLYATFRHNRATTWYAFFTRHEGADGKTVCIVRHITNNHVVAQYF